MDCRIISKKTNESVFSGRKYLIDTNFRKMYDVLPEFETIGETKDRVLIYLESIADLLEDLQHEKSTNIYWDIVGNINQCDEDDLFILADEDHLLY